MALKVAPESCPAPLRCKRSGFVLPTGLWWMNVDDTGSEPLVSRQDVVCDLCGSDAPIPLHGVGRGGQPLRTVVCGRCGFVYISPRPSAAKTDAQYRDGGFSQKARGGLAPDRGKVLRSEVAALSRLRHLELLLGLSRSKGRMLEVGCGLGSFVRGMRGFGWQAVGIEPDPGYRACGMESYGIDILPGLYGQDVRADGPQDLICAFHVLEHAPSPRQMLALMYEDLRAGGWLYLELPSIERPAGGNLDHFFWAPHLSTFSPATLTGLLGDEGLVVRDHGHRGAALWALAQRPQQPRRAPLRLPLDPPAQVVQRTRALHEAWLRQDAAPSWRKVLHRVRAHPRTMASKAYELSRDRVLLAGGQARFQVQRRSRPTVAHLGVHHGGNAGDTVLFSATRRVLDQETPHAWQLLQVRAQVDDAAVAAMNRCAGVVLGGGGLFLRDTNENNVSGWQWNCSLALLQQLEAPLVLFALGYNRFRGQADFEPYFAAHVSAVVQRAAFVGLRNRGSLNALRRYLPAELADKPVYQPCATTMLGCFLPRLVSRPRPHKRTLVLNAAFDRPALRFAGREDGALRALAEAARFAQDKGFRIKLALHATGDDNIIPWLLKAGVSFEPVQLTNASALAAIALYRDADLALGMRGHAQMIPFGLGTPIASVISHDKLAWFLQDIAHPEWGADVRDGDLGSRLQARIASVEGDLDGARAQVAAARERLWDLTRENIHQIGAVFR